MICLYTLNKRICIVSAVQVLHVRLRELVALHRVLFNRGTNLAQLILGQRDISTGPVFVQAFDALSLRRERQSARQSGSQAGRLTPGIGTMSPGWT